MIKNLVFRGGGVNGDAYPGALTVLESKDVLQKLEKVAGTSAGAITAGLVALRYTASQINTIVSGTDFKSFEDGLNPFRLLSSYAIYKGDVFLSWFRQRIEDRGLSPNATFADFKRAGCLDLSVYASNVCTYNIQRFCFKDTPNVPVAEAIRASMSIPGLFVPYRFSNEFPGQAFEDGGICDNYPIDAFDGDMPNIETLGLFLYDVKGAGKVHPLPAWHPRMFIENTWKTLMAAQDIETVKCKEDMDRTCVIDSLGLSSTNFGINSAQREALVNSGTTCMTDFVSKNPGLFS